MSLKLLPRAGVPFGIGERNRERVEALRTQGMAVPLGDATEPAVLIQAHIARARILVIRCPTRSGHVA